MSFSIVTGNLLTSNSQVIVHQCNCITTKGKGLSQQIATKFKYADPYSNRIGYSIPGTIKVFGDQEHRYVISMFAQYYPGKVYNKNTPYGIETYQMRETWFQQCLDQIEKIKGLEEVAFPYGIGCGLAGGNWDRYYDMILNWWKKNSHLRVTILKLNS